MCDSKPCFSRSIFECPVRCLLRGAYRLNRNSSLVWFTLAGFTSSRYSYKFRLYFLGNAIKSNKLTKGNDWKKKKHSKLFLIEVVDSQTQRIWRNSLLVKRFGFHHKQLSWKVKLSEIKNSALCTKSLIILHAPIYISVFKRMILIHSPFLLDICVSLSTYYWLINVKYCLRISFWIIINKFQFPALNRTEIIIYKLQIKWQYTDWEILRLNILIIPWIIQISIFSFVVFIPVFQSIRSFFMCVLQ